LLPTIRFIISILPIIKKYLCATAYVLYFIFYCLGLSLMLCL